MAKIKKDKIGLYAFVGGWVARPIDHENSLFDWNTYTFVDMKLLPSSFKEGDKTEGKHFGGSQIIGMGKLKGRGKYKEYWSTYSLMSTEYEEPK